MGFPKMGYPQRIPNQTILDFLVLKAMVLGYPHFRKPIDTASRIDWQGFRCFSLREMLQTIPFSVSPATTPRTFRSLRFLKPFFLAGLLRNPS